MNTLTQEILKKINDHIGFDLHVIEDIQHYFNDSTRYPDSYRKVMTIEEEMVGSMYRKCAFTDQEGNLVGLNLFNCGLTTDQLDILNQLPLNHLKSLNLSKNKVGRFHVSNNLSALVCLYMYENPELQLLGLDDACTQLARIELFECALVSITFPATYLKLFYIDLSGNKSLKECTFSGGLDFLQILFLRDTAITQFSLAGHFPELVHLYLNENKELEEIEIENTLPSLSTLQLRNGKLANFSEQYIQLGEKEIENKEFWSHFKGFFPKIEAIFFSGNPVNDSTLSGKLENEDGRNNLRTIDEYYRQRESGLERDNENKVLLIGNGGAGKTNILRRLVKEKFNEEWDSTHGINIRKFPLKRYNLYFWDFGGQDIYHNTHRLFMQQDSVYVLAWRTKTEFEERSIHRIKQANESYIERSYRNYKLDYWLNYAKQLGKGSPMIITQTNVHEDGIRKDVVEGIVDQYASAFQDGFFVCHVESDGKRDAYQTYQTLENYLGDAVKKVKQKQPKISAALFRLRQYIRDLQSEPDGPKRLPFATYKEKALALGVLQPERELETWLFKTGVVYYRKGVFDNDIILDQSWVINAIYALFDRSDLRMEDIRREGGKFSGAKLRELWAKDYPDASVQERLLGFMLKSDICYELEVKDRYPSFEERHFVAPKLLPDKEPSAWEDYQQIELHKDSERSYFIKYTYSFLHEKIMESIIARTAYLANKPWLIWQSGTRIAEGNQILYVEKRLNDLMVSFNEYAYPLFRKLSKLISELQDDVPELLLSKDGLTYEQVGREEKMSEDQFIISYFDQHKEVLVEQVRRGKEEDILSIENEVKIGGIDSFKENIPQPKNVPPLDEIENLIIRDKLEEAAQMMSNAADEPQKDQIIMLRRRITTSNNQFNNGITSSEDFDKERNRIAKSLLAILRDNTLSENELSDDELLDNLATRTTESTPTGTNDEDIEFKKVEKKKILIQILSASPENESHIRAGQEYRELKDSYRQGKNRDIFTFLEKEDAVKLSEFQRALRRKPNIVHFSGHGEKEGIFLMDSAERSIPLKDHMIEKLFKRLQGITTLVILNACHSGHQAKLISRYDMHVIGTKASILDKACVSFSKTFYASLVDGTSYQEAYEDAKMQVEMDFEHYEADLFEVWYQGERLNWS